MANLRWQRILLMTGPAGAGKTTTVRLLAEQMEVDIIEWGESVEEWSLGNGIGTSVVCPEHSTADSLTQSANPQYPNSLPSCLVTLIHP